MRLSKAQKNSSKHKYESLVNTAKKKREKPTDGN